VPARPGEDQADEQAAGNELDVPRDEGQQPGACQTRGSKALLQPPDHLGQIVEQALVLEGPDPGALERRRDQPIHHPAVDAAGEKLAQCGLRRGQDLLGEERRGRQAESQDEVPPLGGADPGGHGARYTADHDAGGDDERHR